MHLKLFAAQKFGPRVKLMTISFYSPIYFRIRLIPGMGVCKTRIFDVWTGTVKTWTRYLAQFGSGKILEKPPE